MLEQFVGITIECAQVLTNGLDIAAVFFSAAPGLADLLIALGDLGGNLVELGLQFLDGGFGFGLGSLGGDLDQLSLFLG